MQSRIIEKQYDEHRFSVGIGMAIVFLAAVFYCYEYLLRVAPSVMNAELMQHYQINDFQLGSLTAYYYYIYAPMQLPVGLLVDRYGPKTLMIIACLSCSIGAYLFVCSHYLIVAKIGRFLVGFGSAFAFVGVLKLATQFLPKHHFAVVSGATMALGQIGAMLGDVVLTRLIAQTSWQHASICAAIFGLGLTFALAVVFHLAGKKVTQQTEIGEAGPSMYEVLQRFYVLVANKELWKVSAIGCLLWAPIVVFAEFLGIDFLKVAHHMSPERAALANCMMFVGMACGGPLVTSLSNHLRSRLMPVKFGSIVSFTCMTIVLYCTNLSQPLLFLCLFLTGLATSSQVLVFPMSEEIACSKSAGTAMAMTNMMVMISGVIFQPLSGYLLNLTNNVAGTEHLVGDFQFAFVYVPLAIIMTFFVSIRTKETYTDMVNVAPEHADHLDAIEA